MYSAVQVALRAYNRTHDTPLPYKALNTSMLLTYHYEHVQCTAQDAHPKSSMHASLQEVTYLTPREYNLDLSTRISPA